MKNLLLFLLISLISFSSLAGQGKDGGWPQSIQLLRIAKQNLIDLLAQSSDQDVKDAINGMRDRQESIRVEDVNLALITTLVKSVEEPDVEKIEKSKYEGVRLFYYENTDSEHFRIYATKNFYNNTRYQINTTDINAAILKEVQTLILHEISHLWGFGEDDEEHNYARMFAVRMINILHGSLKINFTQEEKLASLNKAYLYETHSIHEKNAEKVFNGKEVSCITINKKGDAESTVIINLDPFKSTLNGYEFNGNEDSILRWTSEQYLIAETSHRSFGYDESNSLYMKKKGVSRVATEYAVCHADAKMLKNIKDRFYRLYFTRTNLLTDYQNASQVVYQSLLIQDILFLGDTFKTSVGITKANQNQIIQNIDFKIKVQHKEEYERLTGRKYKYSKPQDSKDMEVLNNLINSGLSTENLASWAQISDKVKRLNSQIINMKNYSRQLQMDQFFKDFMAEFNKVAEKSNEFEESIRYNHYSCGKEKRVGDFYKCQLEINKSEAQARISLYDKLILEMEALVNRFTHKAENLKD